MAYTPNAPIWAAGVAPGISAIRLNHLETQYQEFANLYDAHSVLIAILNNTPVVLPLGASTIVGRTAASNIIALTGAQVLTIIGRIGKGNLQWANNKLLLGAGAVADPTEVNLPTTATREFFVPTTYTDGAMDNHGFFAGARLTTAGQAAHISFKVPHDFSAITSAEVIVIPMATQAAANWDIESDYGAIGEAYNTHSEADAATTYNVVLNQLFAVDISGILTAPPVADDYVGIKLSMMDNAHDTFVLGVRFKYT